MRIATTHTTVKVKIPTTGAELLRTPTNMPGQYSYTFMAQSTHTTIAFEEIVATNSNILLCNFTLQEVGGRYVFGFNSMERDDEVKGSGNSYDFGARVYDPRLGRWLSIDPLQEKYPGLTPYNFVGNNPIVFVDPDGRSIKPGKTGDIQILNSFLNDGFKSKDGKAVDGASLFDLKTMTFLCSKTNYTVKQKECNPLPKTIGNCHVINHFKLHPTKNFFEKQYPISSESVH